MNRSSPLSGRSRSQTILILIASLAVYAVLTYLVGDLLGQVWAILFDIGLLVLGGLLWMAFFSQFVLPVKSLRERWLAFNRLNQYLIGNHGPAIFIEDGDIQHRSMEMRRRGPGVIILDTASAGVLRNPVSFTRPIGPGIVFTEANEYLAGSVDLHFQNKRIGPLEHEDPFDGQAKTESKEAYQRRQERRWETSGLTRDGVEVIPAVSVTFRLDSKHGEGGSMFGYNARSVWRAIASEGIDPNAPPDARSRHVPWNWLPAYLAADLWREYLRKFTLNELFALSDAPVDHEVGAQPITVFEWIESLVFQRLTQEEVESLDSIGRLTLQRHPSREYEMVRKRGIRIHDVKILDLHFPAGVEKELVKQWKATWLQRAQEERNVVDRRRSYNKLVGEENALLEFADAASQFLGPIVIDNANMPELLPDLSDSLEFLVRGSLNQSIRDPKLHPRLTSEKTHLVELIEWIRRQ